MDDVGVRELLGKVEGISLSCQCCLMEGVKSEVHCTLDVIESVTMSDIDADVTIH